MDFIAKYGGKPCGRCGELVQVGQRVRFGAVGKTLYHTPVCPPKPEKRVFFEHSCGCPVGDCVHGEDAKLQQIAADYAAKVGFWAGRNV